MARRCARSAPTHTHALALMRAPNRPAEGSSRSFCVGSPHSVFGGNPPTLGDLIESISDAQFLFVFTSGAAFGHRSFMDLADRNYTEFPPLKRDDGGSQRRSCVFALRKLALFTNIARTHAPGPAQHKHFSVQGYGAARWLCAPRTQAHCGPC